ncbi:MAG: hypothetical protein H6604_06035 [Flavobacteriales bacterium]|nr:hypothetical protein [Flavobacteriales bacterium]
MQKFEDSLEELRQLVSKLIIVQESLVLENVELKKELNSRENKINQLNLENKRLIEENKNIKIASALTGNEEYKSLMKLKVNRLMKEVDSCILQMKNS